MVPLYTVESPVEKSKTSSREEMLMIQPPPEILLQIIVHGFFVPPVVRGISALMTTDISCSSLNLLELTLDVFRTV